MNYPCRNSEAEKCNDLMQAARDAKQELDEKFRMAEIVIWSKITMSDRELAGDCFNNTTISVDQAEFISELFNRCCEKDQERFLKLFKPQLEAYVVENLLDKEPKLRDGDWFV